MAANTLGAGDFEYAFSTLLKKPKVKVGGAVAATGEMAPNDRDGTSHEADDLKSTARRYRMDRDAGTWRSL